MGRLVTFLAALASCITDHTAVAWPQRPGPPTSVVCANASASSITVAVAFAGAASMLDVQISLPPRALGFGAVTSLPAAAGAATLVTVRGLRPSTAYALRARRGAWRDELRQGNWSQWSEFGAAAACKTAAATAAAAVGGAGGERARRPRGGGSLFHRMYRISEVVGLPTTPFAPPDFLRDHNSADALGSASFLSWARVEGLMSMSGSVNLSTITEYCVEYSDAPSPWPRYGVAALPAAPPAAHPAAPAPIAANRRNP